MIRLTPTTYALAGLGLALAASLVGNAWQGRAYLQLRDQAARVDERRQGAETVAQACSDGVQSLIDAQQLQTQGVLAAIERARIEARRAYGAAEAERTRPQAVPGDACASADVETREWLERRRAAQ